MTALQNLGDVLGPLRYLGQCPDCDAQHMSTHDRVQVTPRGIVCERCATSGLITAPRTMPRRFDVTLRAGSRLYGERVAASTPGDARDAALRAWFGDGVFWDVEDGRGRPVRQVPVKRRGRVRYLEKPLAPWGKLSIREVRR